MDIKKTAPVRPRRTGVLKNVVVKSIVFLLLALYCHVGKGQTLQLVPRVGFQFYGLSHVPGKNAASSDFKSCVLEFEGTVGVDLRYKVRRLTHVLSLQSVSLGPSFSFTNLYLDKGIVPTYTGHRHSSAIDQVIVTYGVELESRKSLDFIGKNKLRFNYAAGVGLGLNRSQEAYDSIMPPYKYGMQMGESYKYFEIIYDRSGVGVYLSLKGGVSLYNSKNKCFLNLQAYWHQGLKKMAEYSIHYEYGYFNYPEYQREQDVKLKSRGTVFGMTLGVPIRILN